MSQQQLSAEFLEKVRAVYQESHPVFVQLLQEQKQLKTWIAMLKVSVEINGEGIVPTSSGCSLKSWHTLTS